MPILPENKNRYPKNWKEIRSKILQRAENKCEFCGKKLTEENWMADCGKYLCMNCYIKKYKCT